MKKSEYLQDNISGAELNLKFCSDKGDLEGTKKWQEILRQLDKEKKAYQAGHERGFLDGVNHANKLNP